MESEHFQIDWVGTNRAFLTGHTQDTDFAVELNQQEIELVYDFNEAQRTREKTFLKELYGATQSQL